MSISTGISELTIENPPQLATVSASAASESIRYHYMDNLRGLAMLAGVVFHAAIAYSLLLHEGWPTADLSTSSTVDFLCWLIHSFRMPLFFLVSGFFACLLVEKRGSNSFVKNRALRIALPFVVFWPIALTAVISAMVYAANSTDMNTPIVNFLRASMANPEAADAPPPPLKTMHLWFLYYLGFFCIGAVTLNRLVQLNDKLRSVLMHPLTLFLVFPVITTITLLQKHMPHPAPENFIPELWALTYYGMFYFIGWVLYKKHDSLENIQRFVPLMVGVSVIAYGVFYHFIPKETIPLGTLMTNQTSKPALNLAQIALAFTTALLSWHLSILSLCVARKFLDWKNPVLRFITDTSYWVYLVHIPVLFFLQIYFHGLDWPLWLELFASIVATFAIGLASYIVMVRYTPIGWMLNGRRKMQKAR